MNANLLEVYGAVGAMAKAKAETAKEASQRIAAVLQDGVRLMADGVNYSVNQTVQSLGSAAKCKSPADLAAVQRDWLQGVSTRAIADAKSYAALTGRLLSEVATVAALPKDLPLPSLPALVKAAPVVVPAPVVAAPVVAAPVVAAPAPKVEAPVVVVDVAPVVEAPVVVEAAPVETPVVEAPVAMIEAEPEVVEVEPVVAVAAEPVAALEETPAEETPAEETPAEETPVEAAPAEETPAEKPTTKTTRRGRASGKATVSPTA